MKTTLNHKRKSPNGDESDFTSPPKLIRTNSNAFALWGRKKDPDFKSQDISPKKGSETEVKPKEVLEIKIFKNSRKIKSKQKQIPPVPVFNATSSSINKEPPLCNNNLL